MDDLVEKRTVIIFPDSILLNEEWTTYEGEMKKEVTHGKCPVS
jgi:hypothetical protein